MIIYFSIFLVVAIIDLAWYGHDQTVPLIVGCSCSFVSIPDDDGDNGHNGDNHGGDGDDDGDDGGDDDGGDGGDGDDGGIGWPYSVEASCARIS